jgi:hypothetical protein
MLKGALNLLEIREAGIIPEEITDICSMLIEKDFS